MNTQSLLALAALSLGACATSKLHTTPVPPPAAPRPAAAASGDPRVSLRAGWMDAGEAVSGLRVVSRTPPSAQFLPSAPGDFEFINSDLSFVGNYVIQGNFSGYQVWDISDPSHPTLHTAYVCPGSQSDVSVYGKLMFVSGEAMNGRTDCGTQGVPDTVSQDRLRGIRIFDITDIAHPKYLTNVQTCRGSHTHTVVTDPRDRANVYIYISGTAPVRSPNELAGCSSSPLQDDPTTALFRIEVIRVPLAAPQQAKIVSSPRIFGGLTEPAQHGEAPQDVAAAAAGRCRRARPRRVHRDHARHGARGVPPVHQSAARQHRGRPRGDRGADRRRQRRVARSPAGHRGPDDARRGRSGRRPSRAHPVPRHHRVLRHRARRRRVRGLRVPARHQRRGPSAAHRRSGGLELFLLAFGHLQQRRQQDSVFGRVGRRVAAPLPPDRQARVGSQRHLHAGRATP